MKNHFLSKTWVALAIAIAASGSADFARAQPAPPAANDSALPSDLPPGTPAAEVFKLAQSGVNVSVIQNYINNCPSAFNLDADMVVALKDGGVSSAMINAMMAHDKNFSGAASQPPPSNPAPADDSNVSQPTVDMTQSDFDASLTPYGSWVDVEGYGRCWRPTEVIYNSTWQPYCDRGHWVYTDCGWFWDSDYSWGVTFHYGRWFRNDRFGWCWWPDTVWSPSWVTWRSGHEYCGWAPLPPFTEFRPGLGFFYRGATVAVGFDFGLPASCFTFVPPEHFCDVHPRNFRAPQNKVSVIFNRTTVINNYGSHNRTVVNNGISVAVVGAAMHRPIQPVHVASLPHAARQGWNTSANPSALHNGGTTINNLRNNNNNLGGQRNLSNPNTGTGTSGGHRPPFGTATPPAIHSGETKAPEHSQPNQNQNFQTPANQHQSGFNGNNFENNRAQNIAPPAVNNNLRNEEQSLANQRAAAQENARAALQSAAAANAAERANLENARAAQSAAAANAVNEQRAREAVRQSPLQETPHNPAPENSGQNSGGNGNNGGGKWQNH